MRTVTTQHRSGIVSLFAVLIIFAAGCNTENEKAKMTYEELLKAKWDSLAPGLYGISIKDARGNPGDSIEIFPMVAPGSKQKTDSKSKESPGLAKALFIGWLNTNMPHSQAGYLRIDANEIFRFGPIFGQILLEEDYGPASPNSFSDDSAALRSIPGISDLKYIQTTKFLKEQLANKIDSSSRKFLENIELPSMIQVILDNRDWTKESLAELQATITNKIATPVKVFFPMTDKNYQYVEYRRK